MSRTHSETVRAPAWSEYVDRPAGWAIEHRWLLEAAFAAFERDGEWPLIEDVQLAIAVSDPEHAVAVSQLVVEIPAALGARLSQRVELTVRAISYCVNAAPLLERFLAVMKEAVRQYPREGPGRQPTLRGLQLKDELKLSDLEYRKLSTLLFSEGWFFSGGTGGPADEWTRIIKAEVLLLRDVDTISDYLDAVARYRFGPSEIQVEAPVTDEPQPVEPRWPRRWLDRREVSVLDLFVITIVGGVIVGVVLWLLLAR